MSLRQLLNKIALAICVFLIVSPAIFFFLWMLSLSVKYEIDNASYPPVFIPDRFAWENYVQVLTSNRFTTYFFNTLIVTGTVMFEPRLRMARCNSSAASRLACSSSAVP